MKKDVREKVMEKGAKGKPSQALPAMKRNKTDSKGDKGSKPVNKGN